MLLVDKKRILFVNLILALVLMLTGCFGSDDDGSSKEANVVWNSYSNNHYGIKYPDKWGKADENISDDPDGKEISIYFSAETSFTYDLNDFDVSNFKPFVFIDEDAYSTPRTNEDLDKINDGISSVYSNAVKIHSKKQINLNGNYAYEFGLSGPLDPYLDENSSFDARVKAIVFAEGNYQYKIIYYAMPDNYDSYLGIANEMINSIKIF